MAPVRTGPPIAEDATAFISADVSPRCCRLALAAPFNVDLSALFASCICTFDLAREGCAEAEGAGMPATTARGACATSENALAFASAGVTTGAAGRVRLEATKLSARFGRGSVVDGVLTPNPPR